MKHLLSTALLLLLLTFGAGHLAAQTGIQFSHTTFQEGLDKAAREGKLVFVDAYAEWCGPCKWMASNSFPDEAVGEFFNREFVSMKIDMEKGEGPALSKRFGVAAYPTLLFLDAEGDTLAVAVGAMGAEDLLELGQRIVQEAKAKQPDPLVNAPFDPDADEEESDNESDGYGPAPSTTPSTKPSPSPTPKANPVPAPKPAPSPAPAPNPVPAPKPMPAPNPAPAPNPTAKASPNPYPAPIDYGYDREVQQWRAHVDLFEKMIREYGLSTANDLNACAWAVYQGTTDPLCLQKALGWATTSVQMQPSYYNLDTKAMLLYALGRRDEAIMAARAAISWAQSAGIDYTSTWRALQTW
jgi:thiol-disulfide isomerase/thioredoxin